MVGIPRQSLVAKHVLACGTRDLVIHSNDDVASVNFPALESWQPRHNVVYDNAALNFMQH